MGGIGGFVVGRTIAAGGGGSIKFGDNSGREVRGSTVRVSSGRAVCRTRAARAQLVGTGRSYSGVSPPRTVPSLLWVTVCPPVLRVISRAREMASA